MYHPVESNRELDRLLDSIIELIFLRNNKAISSFVLYSKSIQDPLNRRILEFLTDCDLNSINLSRIFIMSLELSYPSRAILEPPFDWENPRIIPNDLVSYPACYVIPRIHYQIAVLAPFLKPILPYLIMTGNQDLYFEVGETLNLRFYFPRIYSSEPIEDLFALTIILLLFADLFMLIDYYQNDMSLFVVFDLMSQLIKDLKTRHIVFEHRRPYFSFVRGEHLTESWMRSLTRDFPFIVRLRKIAARYDDFHVFNAIAKWRFYRDYIRPMLKYLTIFKQPFCERIPIEFIDTKYNQFITRYVARFIIELAGIDHKKFVELPTQLQEKDTRNIRI